MKNTIYRAARMEAAKKDPRLTNRDRASLSVFCSPEALNDYENGYTTPPCEVVQAMIEAYGTHWLRGEHVKESCPLMTELAPDGAELARAVMGWVIHFSSGQSIENDIVHKFARIARDGRITADEVESAKEIRATAVAVAQVMQETIAAIDTAFHALGGVYE